MICYPNCKINLGLRIVGKRKDGYHNLETFFYPIFGLHDELVVTKGAGQFTQEGIRLDFNEQDNLILRCYRLMQSIYPQIGPVDIHIKKNIPYGAGLGGGSSDAAFMAKALNEIFELGCTEQQLANIVRQLGADCAFFIYNTPCFATGVGDKLTPVNINLIGKRLIMIKPPIAVSTKEAYSGIQSFGLKSNLSAQQSLNAAVCQDVVRPADISSLTNDFELSVFAKYPVLGQIKKRLLDAGAFYAAMSGSGSTIYGLFENDAEGRPLSDLAVLNEQFASMIIFNDTLT